LHFGKSLRLVTLACGIAAHYYAHAVNGLKTSQAVNCFQHDTAVKMANLLQKK
jgi:hypothetical protein